MFEAWLEESLGDPSALLHLAADNLIAERRAGCRKLLIAAAWADCHGAPDDREPDHQTALVDQYVQSGGMGTPLVSQDCAAELGHAVQISVFTARKLIADALTIRHRLPLLWQRVKDGEVWGWKASKIAEATRHLGGLSSWALDRQVTPHLELMAWSRFLEVLDAALLRVDEATYQARAEAAASQRDVRSYRGQYGLRTLVARAEAGDVAAFEALVARVAACLAADGDEDPVAVRRSKALGVIAHQARLRDLLARHADQPDDHGHPEDRVAAHQDDPTDPWADDLPAAGWETARHGNYHQPGLDDLDDLDDCRASRIDHDDVEADCWDEELSTRQIGSGPNITIPPTTPTPRAVTVSRRRPIPQLSRPSLRRRCRPRSTVTALVVIIVAPAPGAAPR
ncbi:MAG TPA: hypothetical protein VEX66_04860, partial [Microlunatus sp.]|nr:hypothetical protein [Microlunatus sp.]